VLRNSTVFRVEIFLQSNRYAAQEAQEEETEALYF
jgi:hypothetical protein